MERLALFGKAVQLFLQNLKRHVGKEILLGSGLILALVVLITAAFITNGFNTILTKHILAGIQVEELKIVSNSKGTPDGTAQRKPLTPVILKQLKSLQHVKDVYPFVQTTFPISATFQLFTFAIQSEAVAEGIPEQLALPHITPTTKSRFLSEGWNRQSDGKVPVLLNGIVYKIMNRILSGIQGGQISKQYAEGFEFDMVFGKTVWQATGRQPIPAERIRCVVVGFTHAKICDLIAMPLSVINTYKQKWFQTNETTYEGCFIRSTEARYVNQVYDSLSNPTGIQVFTQDQLDRYTQQIQHLQSNKLVWQQFYNHLPEPPDPAKRFESWRTIYHYIANTAAENQLKALHHTINRLQNYTQNPQWIFDETYEGMRKNAHQLQKSIGIFRVMSYSMGLLILFLAAMVIFFAFLYLILRREREIGLYRFFGATRLKVTLLLTGEAFVMAFICALAGLILSVVLLETAITWIMNSVAQTYFKDVFQLISSATPANETTPFQINALFQFPWYEAWSFAGIVILAGTLAAFIPTLIASYSNMLDRIRK